MLTSLGGLSGSTLTFRYALASGKTIAPGSYTLGSQFSTTPGSGGGDRWTLKATTSASVGIPR